MKKYIFNFAFIAISILILFQPPALAGKTSITELAENSLFSNCPFAANSIQKILSDNDAPLTVDEKRLLLEFMRTVEGKVPPNILRDIQMRGIGYIVGVSRRLSDEEKKFLKKNIDHLHILTFLAYLNLSEMDLETVPDNFDELRNLRFFKLRDNKLRQLPQAVCALQDALPGVMVDLIDNPLLADVMIASNQKSHELIFRDNRHSNIQIKDLAWKTYLLTPEAEQAQLDEEDNPLAALVELAALCCLGDTKNHTAWKEDVKNHARLKKVYDTHTPEQAINLLAKSPESYITAPLFGEYVGKIRKKIIDIVLRELFACQLMLDIRISGLPASGGGAAAAAAATPHYDSIAGWSRYFTKEPVPQNTDVWLTPEGVQVLFNLAALFDNYYHDSLGKPDASAYREFNFKYQVPFRLSEDIRIHKSIGVRGNQTRPLSRHERNWVIEHLDVLAELSFINHLNLENMDLTRLPTNFKNFIVLDSIYLGNNKFELIPSVCAYHLARNNDLQVNMEGDNSLRNNATQKFDAQVLQEELRLDAERTEAFLKAICPPNLNINSLSWHPGFLARLGVEALPAYEVPTFEPSDSQKKSRDTYIEWGMPEIVDDLDQEIAQCREEHDKQVASHNTKFIHAFFEFMMREAEEFERGIKTNQFVTTDNSRQSDDGDAATTMSADEIEDQKIKAENKAWLDDPLHRQMILSFMAKYSPAEAVKLFKNKKKILNIMLLEKRRREEARAELPELYAHFRDESNLTQESLFDRTESLFVVLLSHLVKDKKAINYSVSRHGKVVKKECLGFGPYFTVEPDVEEEHRGWLKDLGFAELLVTMEFAKATEQELGGAAAAAAVTTTTTTTGAPAKKKNNAKKKKKKVRCR